VHKLQIPMGIQRTKPVVRNVPKMSQKNQNQTKQKVNEMNNIKTITATDPKEFDDKVNEFCENNDVFATQTHFEHGIIIAVCFYRVRA